MRSWPSSVPSGYPPGQPYPGFLRDQRRAWKLADHQRREAKRQLRRAARTTTRHP